jgi:YbbR domain-containing protein
MRDWLTMDFGWKLFSVFLAVVIWLTVYKIREEPEASAVPGVEITYDDLPVLVVSATTDVQNVRVVPNTVDVAVSVPSDIKETFQANQIHVFVNLTGIDSDHDTQCAVEASLPRGVTLISIDPPQLTVTIPKKQ